MTYEEKMQALALKKEQLEKKMSAILQREKTLASIAKKAKRAEEDKRKYKLGGLVMLALSSCEVEDFEDEEVLGALIKCFENKSPQARAFFKTYGERKLFSARHASQQSASAQSFTQAEILKESQESI